MTKPIDLGLGTCEFSRPVLTTYEKRLVKIMAKATKPFTKETPPKKVKTTPTFGKRR